MTNLVDYRVTDLLTQVLAEQYNRVIDSALRGELSNTETLAADKTLIDADYPLQVYALTAGWIVTLPAVAAGNHPFYITNASSVYGLIVKNAGGTTIGNVAPSSSLAFVSNGTSWYALGVQLTGQLGGTAAAPDVRGLRETAGPTLLTLGAIANGQLLKRSGTTLVGTADLGVTNGDSHDHNGGDGAQISHVNLANIGVNAHAQIDTFMASIESGSYTPTLTKTTNIVDAAIAGVFFYIKVGTVVHVGGSVTIDPNVAGPIHLGITLPVASAFSNAGQLAGTAHNTVDEDARISADTGNARASLQGTIANIANQTWYLSFTYRIL